MRHPLYTKIGTTSPTSGSRSVGIVRSRTKATEFSFFHIHQHCGPSFFHFTRGIYSKSVHMKSDYCNVCPSVIERKVIPHGSVDNQWNRSTKAWRASHNASVRLSNSRQIKFSIKVFLQESASQGPTAVASGTACVRPALLSPEPATPSEVSSGLPQSLPLPARHSPILFGVAAL
jgi:hypothetical protein